MESQSGLLLQHVRLRTQDREQALLSKLRLSRLLSAADLLPPGFPPSAVLVVRRLEDPLPGHLSLEHSAFTPPLAWESAVREALHEMYVHASRPQQGRLPSTATAVVFASEAELLACLTLAVFQGRVRRQWWWQALLPSLGLRLTGSGPATGPERITSGQFGDIARVLLSEPARIPVVLSHLEDWKEAVPVVSALTPAEARQVLESLLQAYGLAALPSFSGGLSPPIWARPVKPSPSEHLALWPLHEQPDPPPWIQYRVATKITEGCKREHSALLGIGLCLASRPASVFKPSFQEAFQRWWRRASVAEPVSLTEESAPRYPSAASSAPLPPELSSPSPANDAVRIDAQPVDSSVLQPMPPLPNGMKIAAPDEGSAGIETGIGGAFFLLNMMRVVDVAAMFETDGDPESQLGPWGVLELLTRALLAESGKDFADDPLWRLLAELDARPTDTLPGFDWLSSDQELQLEGPKLTTFPLLQGLSPAPAAYLSLALPKLHQRLLSALGLAEQEATRLPALLLVLSARLYLTRSHLDVVFKMEDARIPVRMSGLDSNPGWLPRFGRVVTFHYV